MSERDEWKKTPLLKRLRSYEYMALDHICCEAATKITELEAQQPAPCKWTNDDPDYGVWDGTCGIAWSFIDDGPEENDCNYCPKCGGKLIIKEQSDE